MSSAKPRAKNFRWCPSPVASHTTISGEGPNNEQVAFSSKEKLNKDRNEYQEQLKLL